MKDIPSYENLYIQGYEKHNVSTTLAGQFLQKSHAILEETLPKEFSAERVLEVGAGSGHHFSYVTHRFEKYFLTDINDQMLELAKLRYQGQVSDSSLVIDKQDATKLLYEDQSFDRLISTHVLEHIPNPVMILKEWNRVIKSGGIMSIVLPCDPGIMWRIGRYFGPRRNATKLGLPYDYVQAADHVNSIYNLVVFIRYHFHILRETWYPLKVPIADLNLFYVCHIKKK